MKIAFKNFITTLRRYKMASVLNIAGLTLAFMAFYVMMVQVTYDLGYNRSIKDAGRILTVNANWIGGGFSLTSPRAPFEAALAQCPEVEGSAIITRRWDVPVWVQESEFSFTEYAAVMDYISLPSLDLLGFRTVEGDLRQIEKPNTVILPSRWRGSTECMPATVSSRATPSPGRSRALRTSGPWRAYSRISPTIRSWANRAYTATWATRA